MAATHRPNPEPRPGEQPTVRLADWMVGEAGREAPPEMVEVRAEPDALRSGELLEALELAGEFLAGLGDERQLSDLVLRLALEQLGARRGSLMLLDRDSQTLQIRASAGVPDEVVKQSRLELGQGVAGWVADHREPVLVSDARVGGPVPAETNRNYLTGTYLSVPLLHEDTLFGVLSITDPSRPQPFSRHDLAVLTMIAKAGSLALQQAVLFEQAKELAIRDDLTGLFNRRYLRHFLDTILERARAERFSVSVVMFDLDHFKRYNDTFGHPAGDRALQEVAHVMRNAFRTHDVVCRYGGEEFCVVLWDHGPPRTAHSSHPVESLAFAERLRHTIATQQFPHIKPRDHVQITISGGLASFPWDGGTRQELITRADQALYRAKRDGRNRIYLSKPLPE